MKRAWTTPKRGLTAAENEDVVATPGGILAVADGATEAFASGVWARLLVEGFTHPRGGDIADPPTWFWECVAAARAAWDTWRAGQDLAWNEELAAARGSAAAIAVLLLEPRAGWVRGLAIGDVIAVRLRAAESPFVWPLTHSSAFTVRPPLIGSRGTASREVEGFTETYQPGDTWLLMTDALAAWTLRCAEGGAPLWAELVGLRDEEAWQAFVTAARAAGMQNDDTTLVIWEGQRRHHPVREVTDDHDPPTGQ
jgi:hypothetical protein